MVLACAGHTRPIGDPGRVSFSSNPWHSPLHFACACDSVCVTNCALRYAACADALDEFEIFGEGGEDGLPGDEAAGAGAGIATGAATNDGLDEGDVEEEDEGEEEEEEGEGVHDEAGSDGEMEDGDEEFG